MLGNLSILNHVHQLLLLPMLHGTKQQSAGHGDLGRRQRTIGKRLCPGSLAGTHVIAQQLHELVRSLHLIANRLSADFSVTDKQVAKRDTQKKTLWKTFSCSTLDFSKDHGFVQVADVFLEIGCRIANSCAKEIHLLWLFPCISRLFNPRLFITILSIHVGGSVQDHREGYGFSGCSSFFLAVSFRPDSVHSLI